MTKVVCVGSQKGGIGKSTITVLLSSYLNAMGKHVFLLDADYPQHSTEKARTFEVQSLSNDAELSARFKEMNIKMYELATSSIPEATGLIPMLKSISKYDYIFIDLPGTLNVTGIEKLGKSIDYYITPMEMDPLSFASGCEAIAFYQDLNPEIKISMVWNKVKKSVNQQLRDGINIYVKQHFPAVKILDTVIYDSIKIQRARSTIYPSSDQVVIDLVDELFGKDGFINQ